MVDRVWVLVLIKDFKETKISIKDITSKELRLYDRETSYKEDLWNGNKNYYKKYAWKFNIANFQSNTVQFLAPKKI